MGVGGGQVAGLWCYPIKSCAGVSLEAAAVARTGLQGDRRWALVDADRAGRFLSQRQCPGMARVKPILPLEYFAEPGWGGAGGAFAGAPAGAVLRVEAPEAPEPLRVPLAPRDPEEWAAAGACPVSVWGWSGRAVDEGDVAAAWFARVLGVSGVRLVRYCGDDPEAAASVGGESEARRPVFRDPGCRPLPPEDEGPSLPLQTAFADGFPILLTSEATLAELNGKLEAAGRLAVPMDRFRPNIVVSGFPAGAEDEWSQLSVNCPEALSPGRRGEGAAIPGGGGGSGLHFLMAKPCARCQVPGVDQASGEVTEPGEPLRTLSESRSGAVLLASGRSAYAEPSWARQAFFGWNIAPLPPAAGRVLRLGAPATPRVHSHSDNTYNSP